MDKKVDYRWTIGGLKGWPQGVGKRAGLFHGAVPVGSLFNTLYSPLEARPIHFCPSSMATITFA